MADVRPDAYPDAAIELYAMEHANLLLDAKTTQQTRPPDLQSSIKVVFPNLNEPVREYSGQYVGHGLWKTSFVLKASSFSGIEKHRFDGKILKLAKRHDAEPQALRYLMQFRAHGEGWRLAPDLEYECCGIDHTTLYHCWIVSRCLCLDELMQLECVNQYQCMLAVARLIAKAGMLGVTLDDCRFYNFGIMVFNNDPVQPHGGLTHSPVIIDPGHRTIVQSGTLKKSQINQCMQKLWKWAYEDYGLDVSIMQEKWYQNHHLPDAVALLDWFWWQYPCVSHGQRIPSITLDGELKCKCSRALQLFMAPQTVFLIAVIGGTVCEGLGQVRLSECCFRAGRELRMNLSEMETDVLRELYERITHDVRGCQWREKRIRPSEEIKTMINFWWRLQWYRKQWLAGKSREDRDDLILEEPDIREVIREWIYQEGYHDLDQRQKDEHSKRHSVYRAALNRKTGWSLLAKAIIRHKMPEWHRTETATAVEQVEMVGRYVEKLATWLWRFARSIAEARQSPRYAAELRDSGCWKQSNRDELDRWRPQAADRLAHQVLYPELAVNEFG